MALTVSVAKPATSVLKVVNNYGMQGSTYNPQQTYNPQPAATYRPPTYNPQPAYSAPRIQPAYVAPYYGPTPQQIAARNAEAQRIAEQQRWAQEQARRIAEERAREQQRISIRQSAAGMIVDGKYNEFAGDWWQREAARLTQENDINILNSIVQRMRSADAKGKQLKDLKLNWFERQSKWIGARSLITENKKRQIANKYYEQNMKEWYAYILAKGRQNERDAGRRYKDIMDRALNNPNHATELAEFEKWFKGEQDNYKKEWRDFAAEQAQLEAYAASPIKGRAAGVFKGAQTYLQAATAPAAASWKVLTGVAQQTERAVNTVKNFVNPNGPRVYYGGNEKTGGVAGPGVSNWQQLKNAYNASKDQRAIGLTKATEQKWLAGRDKKDFASFLIKYGDDVGNLAADPINFLPAGMLSKVSKARPFQKPIDALYKKLGQNQSIRDTLINAAARRNAFSNTKLGRATAWLGKRDESKSDRFYRENEALINQRDQLSESISTKARDWKTEKWQGFEQNIGSRLRELTRPEAELLQRFMNYSTYGDSKWGKVKKPAFSWDDVELPRGFNKAKARQLEDLARQLKKHTDEMHVRDLDSAKVAYHEAFNSGSGAAARRAHKHLRTVQGAYRKSYIPHYSKNAFPTRFDESTPGKASWYLKQQKKTVLQNPNELSESYRRRTMADLMNYGAYAARDIGEDKAKLSRVKKLLQYERLKENYRYNSLGKKWEGDTFDKASGKYRKVRKYGPVSTWKKSVLLGTPRWYVNNFGWNTIASVAAGGPRTLVEAGKLLASKKYREKTRPMRELVDSRISEEIGTNPLAKVASGVENLARHSAFLNLQRRGFDAGKARNRVDDWLFDYSLKNAERPLRAALPFYSWNKGLTKLALKMPFEYPRQAGMFSKTYGQLFERPNQALDGTDRQYTDPVSGQEVSYNERDAHKGYAYINGKWVRSPFYAMTPEQLANVNINPFLNFGADLSRSTDRFGNKITDRGVLDYFGELYPQYKLGRQFKQRNDEQFERWFSESGYSKEAQGQDPKAKNYKQKLDKGREFSKGWKAFLGVPTVLDPNSAPEKEKKRYNRFNQEYFGVDWDKRLEQLLAEDESTAYDRFREEKNAIARKHGYDFEKDIVKGAWAKYDTATSTNTKRLKEEANAFADQYWDDYMKLPKPTQYMGSNGKTYWTPSTAKPYWISKFKEWQGTDIFKNNPYIRAPYYNERDAAGNKTGKKNYISPYEYVTQAAAKAAAKGKSTVVTYDGKWFKSAASRDKYIAGKAKWQRKLDYDEAKRTGNWSKFASTRGGTSQRPKNSTSVKYGDKWFKTAASRDKYIEGQRKYAERKFWEKYFATDDYDERDRLLDANPQFRKFAKPKTFEDALAIRRASSADKKAKIRAGVAGFSELESKYMANVRFLNLPTYRKKVVYKT